MDSIGDFIGRKNHKIQQSERYWRVDGIREFKDNHEIKEEEAVMSALLDKFYEFKERLNKGTTIFFLVFSLIGIAVIVATFFFRKEDKDFFERAVPVVTTISEIKVRETTDSDGKVKKVRKVYVDYEYNGTKYDSVYLCDFEGGMEEGGEIEAFCDPQEPTEIKRYYDVDAHYNEIALVAVFFVVGGAMPMVLTFFKVRWR